MRVVARAAKAANPRSEGGSPRLRDSATTEQHAWEEYDGGGDATLVAFAEDGNPAVAPAFPASQ